MYIGFLCSFGLLEVLTPPSPMTLAPLLLRGLSRLRLRLHQPLAAGATLTPHRSCWTVTETSSTEPEGEDGGSEILINIRSITALAKDILHSKRYLDGGKLKAEDEKAVAEKLLAYHPHCEDKIGCGLSCIIVDRHPVFRRSRCFFVVRTDGVWEDFSYRKCLKEYIRVKYPSLSNTFIRELLRCK